MNFIWLLQVCIKVTGKRNLLDFMTIGHELYGCEIYYGQSLCFLHFFGGDLWGMIKINETQTFKNVHRTESVLRNK